MNQASTPTTFKEMEHKGWVEKAPHYDAHIGQVTRQAMNPLLDAAGVSEGMRVLDIATGPGYGAAFAAKRGARAIGLDFSEAMIREARSNFQGVDYQIGDGENLPFNDGSFDCVICPFGILHMPEPEKAITEAFRVLVNGGRYAFAVWSTPKTHQFFGLVLSAIEAHGDLDVPLPPAPPVFRFSDHHECEKVLSAAGFKDISVSETVLEQKARSAQDVLDMVYNSSVRTVATLNLQTPEAKDAIHAEIRTRFEDFKSDDGYTLRWPAVIASGLKP